MKINAICLMGHRNVFYCRILNYAYKFNNSLISMALRMILYQKQLERHKNLLKNNSEIARNEMRRMLLNSTIPEQQNNHRMENRMVDQTFENLIPQQHNTQMNILRLFWNVNGCKRHTEQFHDVYDKYTPTVSVLLKHYIMGDTHEARSNDKNNDDAVKL